MDKKNRIKKRLQDFKLPALRKIAREMGIPDVDKLRSSDLIEVISEHTDVGTINKKLKINYPLKIVKIISIILSVIGVIGAIIGLIVDSPTFISMVKKPFINSNAILHNFPKEVESSNKLKILVLPFRSYDSNKIDIGKAINKRLSELDTSSMSSYYLESYIPGGNFNADSASQILKESGFDMIIFGEQISGRCNEGTTDEACINYIVNEKHQNFLKEESKNISLEFSPFSIRGLMEGEIQGEIDYVALRIQIVLEKFIGNHKNALKKCEFIYDSLSIQNEATFEELIILLLYVRDIEGALNRIKEYQRVNILPTVDQLFFINSLKIAIYSFKRDMESLKNILEESEIIFNALILPRNHKVAMSSRRVGEFLAPIAPDYAIDHLNFAIDILQELKVTESLPRCYHDMGVAYFYNQNFRQAIVMFEKALTIYRSRYRFEERWLAIRAEQGIAKSHVRLGAYKKGDKKAREIIAMIDKIGNSTESLVFSIEISQEYHIKKEYTAALNWSTYSLKKHIDLLENRRDVMILKPAIERNIGEIYSDKMKFKKAEKWFQRSVHSWEHIPSKSLEECAVALQIFSLWVSMYENSQQVEKAKSRAKQALQIIKNCEKSK